MPAEDRAKQLTLVAACAAADLKADEIIALDVSERLVLTDVFLVASGSSERQVKSIVDAVLDAMIKAGAKPLRREGISEARWVLLDFGDIVVHVQHAEDREFYALERLWKDCPVVDLPADLRKSDDDEAEGSGAGTQASEA